MKKMLYIRFYYPDYLSENLDPNMISVKTSYKEPVSIVIPNNQFYSRYLK
jgi:hypothetical protein